MSANGNRLRSALLASTSLIVGGAGFLSLALPAAAQTVLPTHGVVASGAASIGQSGPNMTVSQTSPRAIVNWNSFSIGQGGKVTFVQPNATSATLNRVTGSTTTAIAGQLDANGQVYLVNPNGISITRGGAIRVGGGFVASTLGIGDADFNKGNLRFTGAGGTAMVSNAGSITAAPGGFVGLLGGGVANSGTISVPLGKVGLGSGEQATLDLTGDGFMQVAIPTGATTSDGRALVDVSGKVRAAGGTIEIKAATAANAVRNAINLSGFASASSAHASGGAIILDGGAGGNVRVNGRLNASGAAQGGNILIFGRNVALKAAKVAARSALGQGGSVKVTGKNAVSLVSAAIDASGAIGGGAIRIGGDFHGAKDITAARTVTMDGASTLNANATRSGNGGTVAVWSNAITTFAGLITATGGAKGGDGGYVEVSANPATEGVLNYRGFANLTAPAGLKGALLLDPFDILVDAAGPNQGGAFSASTYSGASGVPPSGTPVEQYIAPAESVITGATLEAQLARANVLLEASGNITVTTPISWSSSSGLELRAAGTTTIAAPITANSAAWLYLDNTLPSGAQGTGTVIIDAPISVGGAMGSYLPTTLSASVTSQAGPVYFTSTVTLGADVAVSSASGSTTFYSAVDGGHALTVTGGAVSFYDNIGAIAPLAGLNVTGPANLYGNVTTANGPITFNDAVNIFTPVTLNAGGGSIALESTVDTGLSDPPCSGACDFTASGGTLRLAGALGGARSLANVSLTSTNDLILPSITAKTIVAEATGAAASLTLGSGAILTASGSETAVTLAAGGAFINDSGPGAINLTGDPASWLIYSANPTGDIFDNLNSHNRAIWDVPYPSSPGLVPATADFYLFGFQPTVTFTPTSASKIYGQDVTSAVALDYTVEGVQAGVAGAYLGDTAATSYIGAPTVTSAGSTMTATVGTYAITAAAGPPPSGKPATVSALVGYKLAFGSPGVLTVSPEPITITAAANTKTYDGTPSALATPTLTSGTLYDPATFSELYPSADAGTNLTLSPTVSFVGGSSIGKNYVVTSVSATGVINPLPLTYSVANATANYGTTPTLGAASVFGVLPGDSVVPTSAAFSGVTQIGLAPTTPAGTYSEEVIALSNPNYTIAPTGNTPGALIIYSSICTGCSPSSITPTFPLWSSPSSDSGLIGPADLETPLGGGVGGGGGGAGGASPLDNHGVRETAAPCSAGSELPDVSGYADPVDAVRAISSATRKYFDRCQNPAQTQIADALDKYAAALTIIAPRLPPALRNLPNVVASAAKRVRAAPTRMAAVRILREAVAEVHKEISLARADNPDTLRLENRVGDLVAGTLDKTVVTLVRAEGI